jgi:hypothetical protein
MICRASVEDPAKLNSTVVPGCAATKSFPIVRKASVSDAAAKTETVAPGAAGAARITDPKIDNPKTAHRAFITRDFLAAGAVTIRE